MQKKWLILNILVLLIVIVMLVWIVWTFSFSETVAPPEECVEVNKVASFVYDSCYDAFTKNIFLEVHRSYDQYHLEGFEFSFFDFSDKVYEISDVPNTNESKSYKIPAEKILKILM